MTPSPILGSGHSPKPTPATTPSSATLGSTHSSSLSTTTSSSVHLPKQMPTTTTVPTHSPKPNTPSTTTQTSQASTAIPAQSEHAATPANTTSPKGGKKDPQLPLTRKDSEGLRHKLPANITSCVSDWSNGYELFALLQPHGPSSAATPESQTLILYLSAEGRDTHIQGKHKKLLQIPLWVPAVRKPTYDTHGDAQRTGEEEELMRGAVPRQTPLLAYRTRAGPPPSLPVSLPLCPAHPGGLFSSPARANPRLGVSRASRFLVLRKKEQGVGVGQRRQQTGGSEPVQSTGGLQRDSEREDQEEEKVKTPTHDLAKIKTSRVSS
ncbi:hypothetical protein D9C73_016241 [Collichthys lucidus]|uniref:Uncharacterized protein n=1 Tax=Collichthys lucidus TaxID=240159 RepID=A0A4V6AQW9_COLLU|nr:hypothetical protein D9C73_016241 [Collichthys lucidus]